jgi:hypothetical protein
MCATKQLPVLLFPSTTTIWPEKTANSGKALMSSLTRLQEIAVKNAGFEH